MPLSWRPNGSGLSIAERKSRLPGGEVARHVPAVQHQRLAGAAAHEHGRQRAGRRHGRHTRAGGWLGSTR